MILMPDRSTASGIVVQQGTAGKYATVGQRRKRGGKHVRDKQKRRMGWKMAVKVGTSVLARIWIYPKKGVI